MLQDILEQLHSQALLGNFELSAAIELNWQGLDSKTQKLACLLSVFPAPIHWDEVQAVASFCNFDFNLETSRESLIERYLLQKLDSKTYQMHECVRGFLHTKSV